LTSQVDRPQLHTIRAIPKAEVHVHLEGAIELADLVAAARASRTPLPGPVATLFDVSTHEQTGGSELSAFLRFLDWEGSLFRTAEQLAELARRFAARQTESGIRYTDLLVSPTHWSAWRHDVAGLVDALGAGFAEAAEDGLCRVAVCASMSRSQSGSSAEELVDALVARRPRGLVGVSIDGDERLVGRSSARFAGAFARAARAGLRRTAHAGESSGPEGVWDALTELGAERIDHGIRAVEDPRLLDHLAERGVPLGVCPTSNITLGLYRSLDEHPVRRLVEHGVAVTVNTDDPVALGTRIELEWSRCAAALGWDERDLLGLARASFRASFAPDDLRERWIAELDPVAGAA